MADGPERPRRTELCLPSLLKPMDVRGAVLCRLTSRLADIGYEVAVASVSMPRPRCAALKFRLQKPGCRQRVHG